MITILDTLRSQVRLIIENYLKSAEAPAELRDIFDYTLLSSGKLLRPTIVSLFAKSFNVESLAIDHFKLAIEMLHASSLIHDDLPGLDNDILRRGLPSAHIKFGEGKAILAGDLMFAKALSLLCKKDVISVPDSFILMDLLVTTQVKLCEGQAAELELKLSSNFHLKELLSSGAKKEVISILEDINLKKTGALFIAAATGPAILANQPSNVLDSLSNLMKSFSLAFQIRDDLLDSIHDSSDLEQKECNHVSLLGVEASRDYLESLVQNTINTTKVLGPEFSDFLCLIEEVFA